MHASAQRSLTVLVCSAALTVAACSKKEEAPADKPTAAEMAMTTLEGHLSIVAWPGYIENGETDKAYDWVSQFEAETGCKVEV
jgi:putative spermidine/putrescine transport system substrate-binding protein